MKKRLAVLLVCIVFIIGGAVLYKGNGSAQAEQVNGETRVQCLKEVYVYPGDTLWSIAQAYMSPEYASIDDLIEEIQRLNGVGQQIRSGSYLVVPYYITVTETEADVVSDYQADLAE